MQFSVENMKGLLQRAFFYIICMGQQMQICIYRYIFCAARNHQIIAMCDNPNIQERCENTEKINQQTNLDP